MKQTTISVISPSGGVGKSTISKELSIAISSTKVDGSNIRTCLIDTNLNFGSQRALFRTLPKYSIMDWVGAYREDQKALSYQEIDGKYTWEAIEKYLAFIPEHSLYLLPAPDDGKYYDVTAGELGAIVFALKKHFDAIIIDTGNNLDEVTMAAIRISDEALLIVTDEKRSIENVQRLRRRLRMEELPLAKFKVIMNRHPRKHRLRLFSKEEVETILYMKVCAVLPEDPQAWKYNNTGLPLVKDGKSPLCQPLLSLAHSLVPEVDGVPDARKGRWPVGRAAGKEPQES